MGHSRGGMARSKPSTSPFGRNPSNPQLVAVTARESLPVARVIVPEESPAVADEEQTHFDPGVQRVPSSVARLFDPRQAQDAPFEIDERFRGLVEMSLDGMTLVDEQGLIVEWNDSMEQITGLKRSDVLGQPIWEVQSRLARHDHAAVSQRRIKERASDLLSLGQPLRPTSFQEVAIIRPDGVKCVVQQCIFPIRTSKGFMFGGVLRDITDHRRAEQEREQFLLREQALAEIGRTLMREQGLKSVAEQVIELSRRVLGADQVGLWLADPAREELTLLAQYLPHSTGKLLHIIPYDAPAAGARAATTRQIQVVEDLLDPQNELSLARKLAVYLGFRSLLAVPLVYCGNLVGVITYLTRARRLFSSGDLEFNAAAAGMFAPAIENARLNEDLLKREQQVSLLLKATIDAQEEERQRICIEVHDRVAQHLAAASHRLQVLESRCGLPDRVRVDLNSVSALVANALGEARHLTANLRPVALDTLGLAETLRQELAAIAAESGLQVGFDADPIQCPDAVETALYRIVHEALRNVIKHAYASRVAISIRSEYGSVVVSVDDDGIGFDADEIERQVSPRGLGLLGMRKRTDLLGGNATITSSKGKGTRVRVSVPLFTRDLEQPISLDHAESFSRRTGRDHRRPDQTTVLIVDDQTITRQGLRAVLETDDRVRVVGEAADGLQALEMVDELQPRVVLMDIRMPNLDGLAATRRLKEAHPTTAVIVLTNYEDDALVVGAVQAGAAGYLLKGSSLELLCHTIGAVAEGGILIKADLLHRAIDCLAQSAPAPGVPPPGRVGALTPRDLAVLRHVADGWSNREIGQALNLAEVTVKKQVRSIMGKLGVSDRTQAAIVALRLGLIAWPSDR